MADEADDPSLTTLSPPGRLTAAELASLPRAPGPTPDTECVRSPATGEWLVVPRLLTREESMANVFANLELDAETRAKIARAESELALRGFPDLRTH